MPALMKEKKPAGRTSPRPRRALSWTSTIHRAGLLCQKCLLSRCGRFQTLCWCFNIQGRPRYDEGKASCDIFNSLPKIKISYGLLFLLLEPSTASAAASVCSWPSLQQKESKCSIVYSFLLIALNKNTNATTFCCNSGSFTLFSLRSHVALQCSYLCIPLSLCCLLWLLIT